ncbi:Uma2 family endonuclease [Fibrella sp. WM1]|uniref:Uma2 family endonuclease n=1 Tax=Fibrella musci TaxID=3242485 RepID=UPI003521FA07
MIVTTAHPELPADLQTVDAFEAWQEQHVHEGNYEFVRGRVIPKPTMKQDEFYLADFLIRQFVKTQAFQQGDALLPEADSYIDGFRKRIPDLTYVTAAQKQAIRQGERINTLFAIEILSDSESYEDVLDKLQDYFDGGTQLVWYIIPKRQKIFAYTSPDDSKAFKGQAIISADPLVPGFQFVVAELFA